MKKYFLFFNLILFCSILNAQENSNISLEVKSVVDYAGHIKVIIKNNSDHPIIICGLVTIDESLGGYFGDPASYLFAKAYSVCGSNTGDLIATSDRLYFSQELKNRLSQAPLKVGESFVRTYNLNKGELPDFYGFFKGLYTNCYLPENINNAVDLRVLVHLRYIGYKNGIAGIYEADLQGSLITSSGE